MPPAVSLPASSSSRRADLDWLRVGLFAGLIFYHEGLLYEADHGGVSMVLLATHPWRMSLLFLISGAATRFITDKVGAGRLSAERSLRLLPPLIFAAVALVPIQLYLAMVEGSAYSGGYFDFLMDYAAAPGRIAAPGQQPIYGHMWFVLYLWAYTVVLAGALALRPTWFRAAQARMGKLAGMGLLIWPYALLCLLRLTLYPAFGVSLSFVNDWYNHLVSGGMFLLGFLAARSETFWAEAVKARWAALFMAVAGFAAYGAMGLQFTTAPELAEPAHRSMAVFYEMERWGAVVAVLGFGYRHLAHRGTAAPRYLNGAVFTFYIVHEPAMLAAWHWLKPLNLHDGFEAALVAVATLAICLLAYETARRVGWLGVLLGQRRFGWRPAPRSSQEPAIQSA
jgi:peptidoglycan/LPS O-acetylase OafA/YrhL